MPPKLYWLNGVHLYAGQNKIGSVRHANVRVKGAGALIGYRGYLQLPIGDSHYLRGPVFKTKEEAAKWTESVATDWFERLSK